MPKWFGESALNPDKLVEPHKQWVFQWKRVQRYYERSKRLNEKYQCEELSHYDIDDLISFFLNAFHLKDWIISCHSDLEKDLELLFQKFEMGCCRDIANGFKHKTISRPSVESDFNLYREYDHFETDKNAVRCKIAFWDESIQDLRRWDIFELIDIIYEHWQHFMEKHLKNR